MDSPPEEQFKDRLMQLMEEKSVTQVDISKLAGSSQSTVSRWIKGDMQPTRSRVRRIAIHFDLSDRWLLHGVGEKTLTLAERLAKDETKTKRADDARDYIRSIEGKKRTIVIVDSPLKQPRELRFEHATAEGWAVVIKFLEEHSDQRNRKSY